MAAPLFDATALTFFFEDAGSMGLTNCTLMQLGVEGILEPKDFKEFGEDGMKTIFANLFKAPKVPSAGAAAIAAGHLHKIQAFEVSAKLKMQLMGAMLITKFYDDIGHPLDPANTTWPIIKL
jgi:hypothetical protein